MVDTAISLKMILRVSYFAELTTKYLSDVLKIADRDWVQAGGIPLHLR